MVPKFRVWETDRKAMYYTDENLVVCFSDNGVDVIDHTTFGSSCMDIENYEILQSTGLKDYHENEFYDKDIARDVDSEELGIVEYFKGGFVMKFNGGDRVDLYDVKDNFEVIGNKYEHPHLLEGDNE